MSRFAVIFAIAALGAGPGAGLGIAHADTGDEQVVTASRAASPPVTVPSAVASSSATTAASDSDIQQLPLKDAEAPAVTAANVSSGANVSNGPRFNPSLIHGSAGVSIGTGGYRSAYVTSVMPVGDDGILSIAVSQTDYGKNNVVFDRGYGRGYGYGRGLQRGGTQTSVAVALDMGDGGSSSGTPAGCAPGFRDSDGHYVEPVWVTKIHGSRSCEVTVPDPSPQVSTQGSAQAH